jgi:formate dehydrogenase beta subunit
MRPTDTSNPEYFHKVVDCQYACPAHTNVPEYIRLIAQERFTDAYMLNRKSNIFPGILGRVCDRPCEPACRRGRIEEKPVAICRLKRVAADNRGDVTDLLPRAGASNGKKIALIGAGCASLSVVNDLAPMGYECTIFEKQEVTGGLMRSNIPSFRLPAKVLDEEIGMILGMGHVQLKTNHSISSMKALLAEGYDAIFVGSGAPRGKELNIPGRQEAGANIHIGIDWLESVAFGHTESIGKKVLIIGVGNTAMDCCRTSLRLGSDSVKVMARKPRGFFKASEWELEDAEEENVEIVINHSPKAFVHSNGKLTGMLFEVLEYDIDARVSPELAAEEVERCLNCDVQTVFTANLCIECDACVDVCPVDCLTITHNGDEADLRTRLTAPADTLSQDLYISADLPQTGRVMVKDEDVCIHCSLCAERCPTAAWDMQKFTLHHPHSRDEAEKPAVREVA